MPETPGLVVGVSELGVQDIGLCRVRLGLKGLGFRVWGLIRALPAAEPNILEGSEK